MVIWKKSKKTAFQEPKEGDSKNLQLFLVGSCTTAFCLLNIQSNFPIAD